MASFKSSFAAARKAGKKEFSWNGKRYNTKLASGSGSSSKKAAKTPESGPVPASRSASNTKVAGRPAGPVPKNDKPKKKGLIESMRMGIGYGVFKKKK